MTFNWLGQSSYNVSCHLNVHSAITRTKEILIDSSVELVTQTDKRLGLLSLNVIRLYALYYVEQL